jgi:homoserine dehydrogenase
VIFVGVFVDTDRAADVISYGVGAGALVTGLAVFAFATRKDPLAKNRRVKGGIPAE